ncbi:CDGSH iron-sulfur domain-containing protein [Eubacteriaceae bacterium ES3]|nr:CDGSH iron-sulfur domain-containing protein [Eubacteriaceae bacterium ES3]
MSEQKIIILPDGPYLVYGQILLSEKIIKKGKEGYILEEGRELPQQENVALCRCGHSKNPPFCDGEHDNCGFDGQETASNDDFNDRAERIEGPDLILMDDHRCALARFCHRKSGSAWELVKKSDDAFLKKEAILASLECPAGRLVPLEKNGEGMEENVEPEITILQDPEKKVSGGIFVRGRIEIISASGKSYEIRDRVTLCRCGKSENKPFCDAKHIEVHYCDSEKKFRIDY